jgi:DNA repair exonuclease SbcCD nuclease subunit
MEINGKVLITTDWHFGLNNNRKTKLQTIVEVAKQIKQYTDKNNIKTIIFGGDLFHQRNILSVDTINVAIKVIEMLTKKCNMYLILGNHDIFNKNTSQVHSLNIFKHIKNVHIIENIQECSINGNKTLLIPWNSDMSSFSKESYDIMIGHFDISERYLIASYIDNNIKKTNSDIKSIRDINTDDLLKESGLDDIDIDIENDIETIINTQNSSDLIGDWVEVVKPKGLIFAGHIHNHKELYTKNRKFIFIGSPYQQTLGEVDSNDGFYILDEQNKEHFIELNNIPRHIDLKISEIVKNIDNFDFSIVKNNIVHCIYDIEVDETINSKIIKLISDNNPYEELPSDYDVKVNITNDSNYNESIDIIRRSKMEYIQNYIDKKCIDYINEKELSKEKLFKVIKEYYDKANEDYQ